LDEEEGVVSGWEEMEMGGRGVEAGAEEEGSSPFSFFTPPTVESSDSEREGSGASEG